MTSEGAAFIIGYSLFCFHGNDSFPVSIAVHRGQFYCSPEAEREFAGEMSSERQKRETLTPFKV